MGFDEAVVGLLVAALLFAWPVGGRRALAWEEAARIDWGTLVLYGGGLAMAKLVFDTGLAAVLARAALSATGVTSLWGLTALALGASILLTEVAPNAATVGLLAPLALAAAHDHGLPLTPPLLAVCFGAGLGFMLPVGTPTSAMVYGTRLVPLTAMMGVGFVVDLLGFFMILGALFLLCPLLGLL
jgi:sodium-dependent dicarboxylate transporter 2/3/5